MNRFQALIIIFLGVFISTASINFDKSSQPLLTDFSDSIISPNSHGESDKNLSGDPGDGISEIMDDYNGSHKISVIDEMVMVFVPIGSFPMGSADGGTDEQPVHQVYLDAFWIDQTEVTNAQYGLCVKEGVCAIPTDPSTFNDVLFAHHPVVFVDWKDAQTYCQWAGRRLPTEAEWEKAARGTDGRTYPWGDDSDCSRANFWDCPQFETTSPVGSYSERGVSPYGAYDMAGNVWEWVFDWYAPDYYQYSPTRNPTGPTSGIYHVWRGGSWNCNQTSARSAGRGNFNPDYWRDLIGFRCAMSVAQP